MTSTVIRTGLTWMALSVALCAGAETLVLEGADWREVPGTAAAGGGEFFPAYVEVDGLRKAGRLRRFDFMDPNAAYARVEVDCATRRYRMLREGSFETESRIQYEAADEQWMGSESNVMGTVVDFVCRG